MKQRLQVTTAIVTGSGSQQDGESVGYAIAHTLATQGAQVVLVDRTLEHSQNSARRLEERGVPSRNILIVEADVTRSEDCARIVAETKAAFGRVTSLVNCVGVTGPQGSAVETDLEQWRAAMDINVTSMMLMSKHAVPEMEGKTNASIVNISSLAGLRGGHPSLLYPTSKGAVIALTRAMAVHHGRQGIRVNCVAPGLIYTPMVARRGMAEEQRSARANNNLLGTEGTSRDVADAVAFLVSEEARWITSIILPVDAGESEGAPLPVPPSNGVSKTN